MNLKMVGLSALMFAWGAALAEGAVSGGGAVVRVGDFGAVVDDEQNDAEGIQRAIEALAKEGAKLVFEKGRYDVRRVDGGGRRRGGRALEVTGFSGLTIEGNGAELVGGAAGQLMAINGCTDLTIRGLSTDREPLPFAGGKVLSADNEAKSFEVEMVEGDEAKAGLSVGGVLGYDPEKMRFAYHGFDWGQWDFDNRTELVRDNVMRVFVKYDVPRVGTWVNLRYEVYGGNGFSVYGSERVTFEDVTIYCTPGMGLYAGGCRDMTLRRFRVMRRPGTKRWMSATADATHFVGCRGRITMEDCVFDGQGDDATNIHDMYMVVVERTGDTKLRLRGGKRGGAPRNLQAGDKLEIGGGDNPLVPYVTLTVKSAAADDELRTTDVEFEESVPERVEAGDLVGNASACASVRISGCRMRDNRARGFLIQTRDVVIEDCEFEGISASAIQITSDTDRWWEGVGARNVTVRDCRFKECNFGAARRKGVIDIYGELGGRQGPRLAGPGVHRDITIEGNVFEKADGWGVHVCSADGVVLRGNKFIEPTEGAVLVEKSENVQIID